MLGPAPAPVEAPAEVMEWEVMVGKAVVDSLPKSEVTRQKSVMFQSFYIRLADRSSFITVSSIKSSPGRNNIFKT
jgi:hypothetical protein